MKQTKPLTPLTEEEKELILAGMEDLLRIAYLQATRRLQIRLKKVFVFVDSDEDSDEDLSAEARADFLENVVGRIATDLWKNPHKYYFSKVSGDKGRKGRDDTSKKP